MTQTSTRRLKNALTLVHTWKFNTEKPLRHLRTEVEHQLEDLKNALS